MSYEFMPSVYPPVSAGYAFMKSLNGAFPPSCKKGVQRRLFRYIGIAIK